VGVFLNSGINSVRGDKIVFCVTNTEDVQYNVYIYLTVTNQINFFLRLRLQVNDTRFYRVLSSYSFQYICITT